MPERLGDHHDFDWATADSGDLFGQRGTKDAEFVGESAPDVGLPTGSGLGRGATLLQVVPRRQEPAEPVAQQFLFLTQIEVYLQPQSRLGENVPLNFVAAGIDRAGPVVEVAQWCDRLPRVAADVAVRLWLEVGHRPSWPRRVRLVDASARSGGFHRQFGERLAELCRKH